MSLENAELADGADKDEDEAGGAHATDSLVLLLREVFGELLPDTLLARGLLVVSVLLSLHLGHHRHLLHVLRHLFFLLLRSVVVLAVMFFVAVSLSVLAMSSVVLLLLLGLDLHLLGFLRHVELFVLLLHFSFKLLLEVHEELGKFELLLLEVSATEIEWLSLITGSDVHLVSDLWIHILELALFSEKEAIEHEESKDAVEGSSEGNQRVLLSAKGGSDGSSHSEHPHGSRE